MGLSLRHNLTLPFEFPSIIWKLVIGIPPDILDVQNYDTMTYNLLQSLRNCTIDEFEFNFSQICFSIVNVSGEKVDLFPNGGSIIYK